MLTSRTLWVLSIMYFCSNAGWSLFITYDTKYLQTNLGLSGWGCTSCRGCRSSSAGSAACSAGS